MKLKERLETTCKLKTLGSRWENWLPKDCRKHNYQQLKIVIISLKKFTQIMCQK